MCTPGPATQPSGVLAPPRCPSWGCFHSLHSRCWVRSRRWRRMRTRRRKKRRMRMSDGRSSTWLCDPCVVHPASWQNETQTHPEVPQRSQNQTVRRGGRDFAFSPIIQKVDSQAYLQLPCHAHNIVVRWVVLVAVGEHKPDITSKLLSVPVFTTVHLPLMKCLEETKLVSKVSKVILWQ